MHGLPDGGVAVTNQQEPVLQSVLSNHHSKQHTHLIIPAHGGTRHMSHMQYICSVLKVNAVKTLMKFSLGMQFVHGGLSGVHVSRPCADSHF